MYGIVAVEPAQRLQLALGDRLLIGDDGGAFQDGLGKFALLDGVQHRADIVLIVGIAGKLQFMVELQQPEAAALFVALPQFVGGGAHVVRRNAQLFGDGGDGNGIPRHK